MFTVEMEVEMAEYFAAEAEREYHERFAPMATMGDAHREWHLNAGVPMGTPGCPQDACHAPEIYWPDVTEAGVRCGNKDAHAARAYHESAAEVRGCYAASAEYHAQVV